MANLPQHIEQDVHRPPGGEELPSYDDLVQQHGPNSRFGRWRSWIEKRAAERYRDITPEERQRRRERGWDIEPRQDGPSLPLVTNQPPTPVAPVAPELHIQTGALSLHDNPPVVEREKSPSVTSPQPLPFVSQRVGPSHLKLNHFGSRFLPHATTQIRCILPLNSEQLLLIGHDEGLSVLDLFPREWTDTGGIDVRNPDEAQARVIWEGEGVFQMTVIEQGEGLDGTTQGVVLALVGPEPGSPSSKDGESARSLRMYNLLSLTNLAKWAVAQKGARPLDLRRPPNWQVQTTPTKKHRPQSSIARGLKSLIETPSQNTCNFEHQHSVSYPNMLNPVMSNGSPDRHSNVPSPVTPQRPPALVPSRRPTDDSGWDVIDDVPLRWATDFVPLATANSRLAGLSVISYAIWFDENRIGRGGQLLAVATRSNILLYEVPKGERAFRFVKDFYTPMQPRDITFFQQTVQEVTRSLSDVTGGHRTNNWHKRAESASTLRYAGDSRSPPSAFPPVINYGPQLSLFVIFDKKASWIRIVDSAVGEMELPDDSYISSLNQSGSGGSRGSLLSGRDTLAAGSHHVRSRLSFEHLAPQKWILPIQCELPVLGANNNGPQSEATRKVIFLTRGRKTHILPSPLPTNYATYPSLAIVTWKSPPRNVVPRLCEHDSTGDTRDLPPFLQLVAFGEDGLEVQEMSLNFISRGKGKSKVTYEEVLQAEDDVIGTCGFLTTGGHWDQVNRIMRPDGLTRTSSTSSDASYDSVGTSVIVSRLEREKGAYAWWKKGAGDYRVFWVGGSPGPDQKDF